MAEYKLIHFNTRFLAEPIRFIFAYAKVPYEDCRVTVEEWNKLKESEEIPWGQLPILILSDGRRMGQSSAISDYLAKKFDLCGLDDWDVARCKEISGSMRDLRQEWRKFFFQKNRERKNDMKNRFMDDVVPRYFGQLSKMMINTGGDWLVCDVITWADLLVAHTIGFLQDSVDPKVLDAYPNLLDLKDRIWKTPQISTWVKTRPKPEVSVLNVIPMNV